ncbi:(R)-mandelonitrile lyase [Shimia abyssi]|uniref:Quercetin dioxygenase-like cupin family protein n=1 Tax=Shimia abyssi TaxID=1662395 RepID=A0A2P8FB18_9RHOB|nr:cupin domain-containing protein [Shimia abyssi]PSL18926.1 quercetin dioxygenase-like cupin family protein [Shimia abyssi]
MDIFEAGSRASQLANSDYFAGRVWQNPIVDAPEPARLNALWVTFEPCARTAWHTHPLGQTLHVVSGAGLVCSRGAAPRVIRAGDTVWIPPGEEHWHGAGPDTGMVHLAMQEKLNGRAADWLEHVSAEDYARAPVAAR